MQLRCFLAVLFVLLAAVCTPLFAQTETATLSGYVTDPSGGAITGAEVQVINVETKASQTTRSNQAGLYLFPSLPPGQYRMSVKSAGFKEFVKQGLVLHVQDTVSQNFKMELGSVSESITVSGGTPLVNTESAAVSTVVDRHFVENLPLNGRSFQTLIELTPGVVFTPTSSQDPGQFSANGQRASANYFMIDGVSANIGITSGAQPGQTLGGAISGVGVLGGTNNLVSVDALQEFRIQTSTYAPEFGRSPGAQISVLTRSGTNQLHGALFDYFRNDLLDANDWFSNHNRLPKSKDRQNDFGGVLGGPIVKNRIFFFFSYEGLRLRLPQTGITTVPTLSARQSAPATVQPFLNAFPLPNGNDLGNGRAEFNAGFSNQSTLNSTSVRLDHTVNNTLSIFGRYADAPSELLIRGFAGAFSLSTLSETHFRTQTVTVGATWNPTHLLANDLRFNYSRNSTTSGFRLDSFGGAAISPVSSLFPSPFSSKDSAFALFISSLQSGGLDVGKNQDNLQRQLNFVDNLSLQRGVHALKLGLDYRRLFPVFDPGAHTLSVLFPSVQAALAGSANFVQNSTSMGGSLIFRNLGVFAQDTWNLRRRLTLTYGLRWDVDFAPETGSGPALLAVTGFDSLSTLALAPSGSPVFKTRYTSFAPRVGVAYQLSQLKGRETILRGGFGVFYDLATQQIGDAVFSLNYPFGASKFLFGTIGFPLDSTALQPPPITQAALASGNLIAFDPDLRLPYTLQWNAAVQQSLGNDQAVSISYVASVGRRLIQTENVSRPNPSFGFAELVSNASTSDYHALQLQFQRRLSRGLQVLSNYAWSHSIDTASSSSSARTNAFVRTLGVNSNRGASDFDVRHSFSAALTYDIPVPPVNAAVRAVLGDWSIDNIVQARSALPVAVFNQSLRLFGNTVAVRPDVVAGVPFYLSDPSAAGDMRLNPAAFRNPPLDPATGQPSRQGTLGRNALRGFGAAQWDFTLRRQFKLSERLHLQFRAEFFNLLNHPNFGNPVGNTSSALFGRSIMMLSQSLGGTTLGGGGFTSLYQIGGPRSIQFALKLRF